MYKFVLSLDGVPLPHLSNAITSWEIVPGEVDLDEEDMLPPELLLTHTLAADQLSELALLESSLDTESELVVVITAIDHAGVAVCQHTFRGFGASRPSGVIRTDGDLFQVIRVVIDTATYNQPVPWRQ